MQGPGPNPWVKKIPWRRKCQPTSLFLFEESHGQKSLAGYGSWSRKGLDMTEHECDGRESMGMLYI